MATWLLSAFSLLRSLAIGTPVRAIGTGVGAGILGGSILDDDDRPRRRRRRRALTQADRNDIAFIAATISKTAAGSFAVQLATRSR